MAISYDAPPCLRVSSNSDRGLCARPRTGPPSASDPVYLHGHTLVIPRRYDANDCKHGGGQAAPTPAQEAGPR